MDGRLAVLFFVVGLTDMKTNDCETGCLARTAAQDAISLSFGNVIFQEKSVGQEAYVRFDMGTSFGPFQPAVGLSVTDTNDVWVGLGATHTTRFWDRPSGVGGYAQLHVMPGVYTRGTGPDLGHQLEIRSGAEIGYQAKNGLRYGLSYDHRSNAGLSSPNPGMETLQFRVSVPLN
jgi:lipid A 3-O-deacylase